MNPEQLQEWQAKLTELRNKREKLAPIFDLVVDKTDWKNPILSYCKAEEIADVYNAIIFFTATEPNFWFIGPAEEDKDRFKKGDLIFKVQAKGYRAGPVGDH